MSICQTNASCSPPPHPPLFHGCVYMKIYLIVFQVHAVNGAWTCTHPMGCSLDPKPNSRQPVYPGLDLVTWSSLLHLNKSHPDEKNLRKQDKIQGDSDCLENINIRLKPILNKCWHYFYGWLYWSPYPAHGPDWLDLDSSWMLHCCCC